MIEHLPRGRGRRAQAKGNASSGKLYAVVSLAVGVVGIVIAAVSGASSSEYLSHERIPLPTHHHLSVRCPPRSRAPVVLSVHAQH